MKIKLGTKIVSSFVVILLLMGLVSYLGISGMNEAGNRYEEVVSTNLPVAQYVFELRAINLEQVAAARGYLLYKDERYIKLFSDKDSDVEEIYREIELRIRTEESRQYLNQIKDLHKQYSTIVQEIFSLSKSGREAEAMAKTESGRLTVEDIKKVTADWISWVGKTNEGIVKTTKSSILRTRITSLVIIALALIIGLGIGFYLTRSITAPIVQLTKSAGSIAQGDLTLKLPSVKSRDEIKDLVSSFELMISNLRTLIASINTASIDLVGSSGELAVSAEEASKVSEQVAVAISELAKGVSDQAASTEKGNVKIIEISESVRQIAYEMNNSELLTQRTKESIITGEKSVRIQEERMKSNKQAVLSVTAALTSLSEKSKEIGDIVEVIKGIANQTNLLSLNAAIEAARAGEQGRGFSVVAEEVRKLAEQSASSVKRIGEIIMQVRTGIEQSVNEANISESMIIEQERSLSDTVAAFRDISESVNAIIDSISNVAEASKVLNGNAGIAADEIGNIASIAQETAASTEEISASTEEQASTFQQIAASAETLANLANKLQEGVQSFKV
jgi:methyl-accepting chemotaxis protein